MVRSLFHSGNEKKEGHFVVFQGKGGREAMQL